jgi:glycosyltransferase involved in cell wall biosynthesis
MPFGPRHGWGICSQYLAKELARLTPLFVLTENFSPKSVNGVLDYEFLRPLAREIKPFARDLKGPLDGAVLQAMMNDTLAPWEPKLKGALNLGYIFAEQTVYAKEMVEKARQNFDVVVAGSSWCESILRAQGLDSTRTVVQGVDRTVFNPAANQKTLFPERFVVFSGGKFEYRKGQDLALMAFRALLNRHDDALLVASWFNPWPAYMQSMCLSPHITFSLGQDYASTMAGVLAAAGIPKDKVILLPPLPHFEMARIYKNSDVGVFPNRCEGGTNLVLMEYMACAKPAIVSNSTGHRDVAGPQNSLLLNNLRPLNLQGSQGQATVWDDPDPEELTEKLLWAYDHPEEAAKIGWLAGRDMEAFTWEAAARRFYQIAARGL